MKYKVFVLSPTDPNSVFNLEKLLNEGWVIEGMPVSQHVSSASLSNTGNIVYILHQGY
jgi:hypothetical protein